MLKVLHFYKTYYPDSFGGVEQVIFQLSEAGVHHQIQSTILSLSARGDIDNQKVGQHIAYYAYQDFEIASTPFSISAISKFKKLAAEANIIHYHFPYPFMDLLHFTSGIKKPTIVSYHSDIIKQKIALRFYSPLMDKFLNSVDYIVAASYNYVKTSLVLQKYLSKVKVIPYGLDKKTYPVSNEMHLEYWRRRFSGRFFLFVGTLRYYKGMHILLKSMQNTSFSLVIIGSGATETHLKKQAKDLGLKNIYFLGMLPDKHKAALFQLCYSVIFPSHLRSEAFGITLLEGAMYGKSLISTELGTGTTYININQETGLVVPPSNPQALRAAMGILWRNPQKTQRYGENAAKRFQALFTSERMAASYIKLYHQMLNK
ncbi:glycosyltransferase [Candidatus Gillettellia adelgis]